MTVLLEGNGKRCEELHTKMPHMSSRKGTSPVISTTHDGNTRQTFRQDCNGLSYRFHGIQQGKQAYPHYHRLVNRMARSNTNPEQVC